MEDNLDKVKSSIERLRNKEARIYFLTQDVKGNAKASVKYIYQMAMSLKNSGFNPIILHEKNDYQGVASWLDQKYMDELPHQSIENQNLEISPEDFLVIPEIYAFVMDQVKNLPCAKIVLLQTSAYMLETLQPGQTWLMFGFHKCITTSEKQKEYSDSIIRNVSYDVVTPLVPDVFSKAEFPPKTIIAINTRDHSDTANIIKAFYLKYPQYRWFSFRDMRGLSESEFANAFKECFLSVWVDDKSGFGTFPIESMASGVPVLAKIPDLVPEWMTEDNGIYVNEKNLIVDQIALFIQNWLEDNINPELYEKIAETAVKYQDKNKFDSEVSELFGGYFETRANSFEEQISKID